MGGGNRSARGGARGGAPGGGLLAHGAVDVAFVALIFVLAVPFALAVVLPGAVHAALVAIILLLVLPPVLVRPFALCTETRVRNGMMGHPTD